MNEFFLLYLNRKKLIIRYISGHSLTCFILFYLVPFILTWLSTCHVYPAAIVSMMASSNGNSVHVAGPLCGESTGNRWRGALMFSLIYASINGWANNRGAVDLRRHRAHYYVTVMFTFCITFYRSQWFWWFVNGWYTGTKVLNIQHYGQMRYTWMTITYLFLTLRPKQGYTGPYMKYTVTINTCPIQIQQLILWGLIYLIFCFHLFGKNILSAMYGDWGSPHLSLVVCYIFHLLIPLLCKPWFYKDCNRNCKNPVLGVIRTLGTSNQAIYCNLLNIYFSSLIDLDTLIIMSPKIDAPYLWIRPLDLAPLNLACGLL